jgi:type II secretory pathway component PulC
MDRRSLTTLREFGKRLPTLDGPAVVASALAALLLLDGGMFYRELRTQGSIANVPVLPPSLIRLQRPRQVLQQQIIAAHLFGSAAQVAEAETERAVPLVLTGTLPVAGQPERGAAILGPTLTRTRLLRVGEALEADTVLRAVFADHVVIERAGRTTVLMLPKALHGNGWFAYDDTAAQMLDERVAAAMEQDTPPRPNLDTLREKIASVAAPYSSVISMQGSFDGGIYYGVAVRPGAGNTELFERLGFHPGDVINGIDGLPLNDPAMLQQLSGTEPVTLSVHSPEGDHTITLQPGALLR